MLQFISGVTGGRNLIPFIGVSLCLHALPAALIWGFDLELRVPRPEITWLDLDNTLGAPIANPKPPPPPPPAPAPEPPKVEEPTATPEPPKKKKKKPKKKKKKKKPAPEGPEEPFTTDKVALGDLAAGDAALMLLLRMDRLRGSPYEGAVRSLLEVFYDHKTLLWSSGLDIVKDFDAVLIATPNPYRVTRTLLAVRHSMSERKLRRALARAARYDGKRLRWRRKARGYRGVIPTPPRLPHDPRVVVTRPGLALLVDPGLLPRLDQPASAAPDAEPDSPAPPTWAERLAAMQTTGGRSEKGPAMLLQGVNLPRLIRLPPDMPVPQNLKVTIEPVAPARPEALLTFASEAQAAQFLRGLPPRLERARRSILLRLLGVVDLLDAIKFKQEGLLVRATVQLTAAQVRQVLGMFREMIPQVRVPGMQQRRLPDAGVPDITPAPDQGAPDQGAPDAGVPAPEEIEVPSWAEE